MSKKGILSEVDKLNKMEITVVDIWWNKIKNYGWKIEDIPKKYKELRKELRRRLKNNNES